MGKHITVQVNIDEYVDVTVNVIEAFKGLNDEEKQEALEALCPAVRIDRFNNFLEAIDKAASNFHVVKNNLGERHKEILKRLLD
jgi:predicted nucleotide-binding protein (sugar kinase/HSP70/actin superfamily)